MATQIQLTRSGTPGAQPTATEMELGELALNYADGKLYFKNDSNNIEQLNSTYNNSGQKIYVNEADNHIGLNTISPEFLLDLGGGTGSVDNTLRIHQNNGGTAIRIGAGSGGSDVTLLRIDGDSSDVSDGSSDNNEFGFSLKYLGTGTGNDNKLVIMSDDSADTDTQVMAFQVLQDGTIGISKGTSFTPNTGVTLDVEDDVQVTGTGPTLRLHKTDGDNTHDQAWIAIGTNITDNALEFQTRDQNGNFLSNDYRIIKNSSGALNHQWSIANTEKLRLDSTGLGIGTTASEALDVSGNTSISGTITAGGIIQTTSGIDINSGGDISATNITASNDITATGNISATDITATGNVTTSEPTSSTHATTKNYVDDKTPSTLLGTKPSTSGFTNNTPIQNTGKRRLYSIVLDAGNDMFGAAVHVAATESELSGAGSGRDANGRDRSTCVCYEYHVSDGSYADATTLIFVVPENYYFQLNIEADGNVRNVIYYEI